eukprot:CAMPEP_0177195134 /NCGR_PEP_ID=MMETSP0367-20130122/23351_1 /TAXON_ID=447022 ORGANISM="Scrippsiella hangoei-like, Strain SHHI-4" /NCGR_SAMPLE_ID=MMETSP0367 /ASSEMBLY_ACC=CAM_ASM_000362 /LENGTH=166 /DNA_ID=CAMNT_0018643141 /DNA_START=68 /DNA_END=566 /DNA_ORIENTATION=-
MSLKSLAKSAGVTAAEDLHFVQQRPSKNWSNSGQSDGGQTTSRHKIGSALLFMPTPPDTPLAQDLSPGTLMLSAQQRGQHVPVSSGDWYLKGGLQSTGLQVIPSQVSTAPPAPGEYTGYLSAPRAFKLPAEARPTNVANNTAFIASGLTMGRPPGKSLGCATLEAE